MKMSFIPGLLFLTAAGSTGCATTQALHTESSTAAIRSAEELGAPDVPQASLHLQLAKEELDAATALNAKGDDDEAKSLLMRAEADAELAVALSRADADKTAAQAAMDRVRKLQSENPYAPGGAK
jgi:regulator of protease activity HflC (stomatin/prohibitin superfamily)